DVEALTELGWLLRAGSGLWREARRLADAALAVNPDATNAVLLRDATLRDERLPELGDAEVLAAAARPRAGRDLLRRAADATAEREPALALSLRRRLAVFSAADTDVTALASALARTGAAADAIALLRQAAAFDPFAPRLRLQLVELLL